MNWKYLVIGIGVVAIIGGAGTAYWFSNNQTAETRSETPQTDRVMEERESAGQQEQVEPLEVDTSDWKIYRNEELGLEMKYPEAYTDPGGNFCGEDPRFLQTAGDYEFLDMGPLSILIYDSEGVELADFVESKYSEVSPGEDIGTPEARIINSHEFLRVSSSYQVGTNQIYGDHFAAHRGKIMEFHYRVWPAAVCEHPELAEEMLNTIVFFD